jgi:hypothetical protein
MQVSDRPRCVFDAVHQDHDVAVRLTEVARAERAVGHDGGPRFKRPSGLTPEQSTSLPTIPSVALLGHSTPGAL